MQVTLYIIAVMIASSLNTDKKSLWLYCDYWYNYCYK